MMTRKQSVLIRVSSLAIAAALTATAAAQSLLGDPTVTFGSVNIFEGASTTDLDVQSTTAVIDWVPDDNAVGNFGAIAFQQSGTTATFSSVSDFAVLNRINVADSSRIVAMGGAINSLVDGVPGRGSIFFYSPSGFVIGSSAVINVGTLVLTASPIAVDGNGSFISGTTVTFNQAVNPNAAVNTVAGSQINANGSGSYVALVAPHITHQGTIRTDTAAALVAAEAATINFSPDGLFDIQVTVGTDDPNGIHVEGGTIARNSATEGVGNHYAYLVAVAKNDAVTMLVNSGGSVGFDTATSAAVEDNVVVLSGGNDILNGGIWTSSGVSSVDLNIDNAAFSTDTIAIVSGAANINSASGATGFGGYLSLTSGGNTLIEALNGNSLGIAGNLFASAFSASGGGTTGQQVELRAQGSSTISVGGNVSLNADSFGADAADDGLNGANATGGNVIVRATNSGTITISGSLDMSADGFGGNNFFSNGAGGNGTGGLAYIQASGGGTVGITGTTFASAEGYGGSSGECSACLITGGTGTGGQALVSAAGLAGNAISFGGDLNLSAAGFGGAGDVAGGSGLGGIADLFAADGATVTVAADTEVDASGFGGYGFDATGGLGLGGRARISTADAANTLIDLTGDVFVTSDGLGGDGGQGGTGTGGQAQVAANLGEIHAHNNLTVVAASTGGSTFSTGGNGGDGLASMVGGDITESSLFSGAGTLTVDGLTVVSAIATGGDASFAPGGNGGDAVAGSATIHAGNSDLGTSVIQLGNAIVMADAFGGAGGSGTSGTDGGDGGDGGNATAGRAVITAAAGSGDLTAGATILSASAEGGAGGSGGNSDGGNGGGGGDGGQAIGGFINAGADSGDVSFAQGANNGTASYTTIIALTTATGGSGGNGTFGTINGVAGNGGAAFGGQSVLQVRGSLVTVGDVNLDASAFGGDGGLAPNEAPEGSGGDATAGQVGVVVTNRLNLPDQRGTLNAANIVGTSIATGGSGLTNGLSLAIGGNQFSVLNSDATIASVSLVTTADAFDFGAPETFSSPIEVQNGAVDIAGGFLFLTPGSVSIWAEGGTMNAASITVGGDTFIHDDAQPFPPTIGTISADLFDLSTNGDLIIDAHLVSTSSLDLSAPGLIDVEDATSGSDLTLNSGASISGGSMTAAGLVTADAPGDIGLNFVIAGTDIDFQSTAGSIATNAQSAGGSIFLDGATGISTGDLTAGNDILLDSGASMSVGNVLAQVGSVQASAVDVLSFLSITAGTFVTIDPTAITGGDIIALAGDVTATGDSIDIGNVTASDNVFLTALAGDLSTANISAGIDVTLDATGAITTGDISAFGTVDANGGSIDLGGVSGSILNLVSNIGDVSTGDLVAFSSLTVDSADDFLFGSIVAPLVDLNAPGSIIGGFIDSATDITAVAGVDIDVGDLTAGGFDGEVFQFGDILLTAGGDMSAGLVAAAGAVSASAGGGISTGAIDALDFVELQAISNILTGNILAGDYITIFTDGGITTGNLTGTIIDLDAFGDVTFGDVLADDFEFETDGDVTGGNIVASEHVGGDTLGAVVLGDISVGPGLPPNDDFSVGIAGGTSVTVGDVSGASRVGFTTLGDLNTGDIVAGDLFITMVGSDTSVGSVTTAAGGTVYMADASMYDIGTGGGEFDFDYTLVIGLDPVPTGGSITIGGPVSTGLFQAAAGDGLTTQAITADQIEASAGGTATINGLWQSPDVELWSSDIDIAASGGIDGGSQGVIRLVSTNATQALIGDGLTGTGYVLTNAEFGRLSAGNVQIFGRGDASAAIDMLIGDLSITGPTAGSTLEDPLGALVFATGDPETQTAGGVIRIVGDVTAIGFADTNAVEFYTGRFELDAATGSISIFETGTILGGELYIEAGRIHVASGTILDQLAVDPHYAGYEDDINAPAEVQRPEGVVRAGSIVASPTEAVLVQNTGTADQQAGFAANFVELLPTEGAAPGSIELIINGQVPGEGGTLFGVAVRDAMVTNLDLSLFTDNSMINGCLLTGACGVIEPPEPPFPPGFTPTPDIQDEIVLLTDNPLPPPEFGNEDFIDDNDETTEEGETSPIEPPQPLFDTSGLGDKGDVDDPVSGSGNPALMETPPPTSNQEEQP